METDKKKPIFIGIINHNYTPNNYSIIIVKDWFSSIYNNFDFVTIDTYNKSKEEFQDILMKYTKGRETIGMYLCIHGIQQEDEKTHIKNESLKLNEKTYLKDEEFTKIINSFNEMKTFYFYSETCHSGGLINNIKIDKPLNELENYSCIILNISSKDYKCYVLTDGNNTIGISCKILMDAHINPFKTPEMALMTLKRLLGYLKPKLTIIKNIS